MEVCGEYAFITGYNLGVKIIDIEDPTDMYETGSYYKAGTTNVSVFGDYAYVTFWTSGDESGMEIISIADPANPVLAGTLNPTAIGGLARHVFITGDKAYIADGEAGLTKADISDVEDITITGTCSTGDEAVKITSDGTYIYVADGSDGLQIVDPDDLQIIGSYDTVSANDVALQGDYAYIADGYGGMTVIDVAAPVHPLAAGLFNPGSSIKRINVTGGYAYLTASSVEDLSLIHI